MLTKQPFQKLFIVLFLIQITFISGCASNKYTEGLNASGEYRITDRDVLEFNNHVRHMMRLKMKYATIAAYTASTVAIGTATAATILTAGGAGSLLAIGSLAGTSAFSSDIMGIFGFSDTTLAYQDGVALMEQAEARYFRLLAIKNINGVIDMHSLSVEAANLYSETIGALTLVEKALASRIPTMADVKQAVGNSIDNTKAIAESNSRALSSIFVSPSGTIVLEKASSNKPSQKITFKGDLPIKSIVSLDEAIVSVKKNSDIEATLTGEMGGESTIVILSANGYPTRIDVKVSSPIEIKSGNDKISLNDQLTEDKPKTYTVSSATKIESITIEPSSPCTKKPPSTLKGQLTESFTIQCSPGSYSLTVINKYKTKKIVTLNIISKG